MSKKLAYERYVWFHNEVKFFRYPNSSALSKYFEISQKQAQRDIIFMRDRLGAPLIYDFKKRGYFYSEQAYELPPFWINEEELLAVILSSRLSSVIPDREIQNALKKALSRFISDKCFSPRKDIHKLLDKVSVRNICHYKVDESIFHQVLNCLISGNSYKIIYYSPYKNELTERIIKPLNLHFYMGKWYLIAYCGLKRDLRHFALSRIRIIEISEKGIKLPETLPSLKEYLEKSFGLIRGGSTTEVVVKFSKDISRLVEEQIWHESQKMIKNQDGSITLRIPVDDFLEIKREILRFGADAVVIEPPQLRDAIKQEIKKMKKIYR